MKEPAYEYTNKKGVAYYLHSQVVTLKGTGKKQTIYYFAKKENVEFSCTMPAGYEVVETERTGLPVLKKA